MFNTGAGNTLPFYTATSPPYEHDRLQLILLMEDVRRYLFLQGFWIEYLPVYNRVYG